MGLNSVWVCENCDHEATSESDLKTHLENNNTHEFKRLIRWSS